MEYYLFTTMPIQLTLAVSYVHQATFSRMTDRAGDLIICPTAIAFVVFNLNVTVCEQERELY